MSFGSTRTICIESSGMIIKTRICIELSDNATSYLEAIIHVKLSEAGHCGHMWIEVSFCLELINFQDDCNGSRWRPGRGASVV